MTRSAPRRLAGICCLLAPLLARAQDPPQDGAPVHLCGRVVTWQGEPIAGAAVALGRGAELPTATLLEHPMARTDEDGRFDLSAPALPEPGAEADQLLVAVKGKAAVARAPRWELVPHAGSTSRPVPRAPRTDMGDIVLADGVRLFGRVRDADGKPLPGVRVLARDLLDGHRALPGQGLSHLCHAVSDSSGIFELPCTLPAAVGLDVSHAGYLREAREPVAVGTPLEITMVPSGFVAGRVLDKSGKGVAGAVVQAAYERRGPAERARTEADGSFRLPVEYAARYRLLATLPTGRPPAQQGRSEVLEGPRANLELVLDGGAADRGADQLPVRAVDKRTGAPLRAFRVGAVFEDYANRNRNYLEYRMQWALQDEQPAADGVLEVPGPARNAPTVGAVRVLAKGYAPATARDVEWKDPEPGKPRAPLVVELVPEATVAGKVVDERTGEAIAGAKVWARVRQDPNQGIYGDRNANQVPPDAVTTAADGSFTLGQLGEGEWQLFCSHDKRPRVPPETIELSAEEQRQGVALRLPAGAEVAGRITGMPIPQGCRVFLYELPRVSFGFGSNYITRYTNSEQIPESAIDVSRAGAFAFTGVKLENYLLVLVLPSPPRCGGDLCVPLEPFRVRAGGIHRDFDVGQDQPGSITGKVTFPRAAVPFDRLVVVAQPVAEDQGQGQVFMGGSPNYQGPRAFVGAGGQFAVRVGPGSYLLHLVDIATGLQLAASDKPVRLKASDVQARDLAAALTDVRVRLEPDDGVPKPALVDRLEIRLTPKVPAGRIAVGNTNENYDSGIGVPVAAGSNEIALTLPEGNAVFLLRNNVSMVRVDDNRWNTAPLGRQELDVKASEAPLECVVKVAAPPEIPPPPDKAGQRDADK